MKGCLVNSRVLILVNGNPINEFLVSKRLRQGNLLTAFLFNTVAECLCGMMREAIKKNLYQNYKVEDNEMQVNFLQYPDDIGRTDVR